MNAIRIRTKLDSESMTLPQLRPLVGKQVEIIVREVPCAATGDSSVPSGAEERYPLHGSVLRYDDPFDPAVPADKWEAAR